MKVKVLSLLVPALLVAGAANAAEIYKAICKLRLEFHHSSLRSLIK